MLTTQTYIAQVESEGFPQFTTRLVVKARCGKTIPWAMYKNSRWTRGMWSWPHTPLKVATLKAALCFANGLLQSHKYKLEAGGAPWYCLWFTEWFAPTTAWMATDVVVHSSAVEQRSIEKSFGCFLSTIHFSISPLLIGYQLQNNGVRTALSSSISLPIAVEHSPLVR